MKMFLLTILISFILLLTCSCNSHHYVDSDFTGIYTGFSPNKITIIGCNYYLELKENGTYKFYQHFDIYSVIGTGRWEKQDKYIYLRHDFIPTDINSAIMGGSYLMGMDTIQICNANKLLYKKVKLRKGSAKTLFLRGSLHSKATIGRELNNHF